MGFFVDRKSLVCLLFASILTASAPLCLAQSTVRLDKHAQKIYKKLAKDKPGSYLHFVFRNHTSSDGNLEKLLGTSFTFLNSTTNKMETRLYSDVARVSKGETYIGEGTAPRHHSRILHPF